MLYSIIKLDIFNKPKESFMFFFDDRYLVNIFYGIILDIEAIGVSIVKEF